jgi:AraC-like DNA-binding protein
VQKASGAKAVNGPVPIEVVRVCTDDWPEREREAMFRDNVGRDAVVVEPLDGDPLRIDGTFVRLPGLLLVSSRRSALRSDFADGKDRLTINLGGDALAAQCGREFVLKRGDAVAFSGPDLGSLTTVRTGRVVTIEFANGSLHRLLKARAPRHVHGGAPPLLLLRRYLNAILAADLLEAGALRPLALEHIHDRAARTLGAGREAADVAKARGVRAARLQAIKGDIMERLQSELSLDAIATRHRVSSRYARMLFESEGTSFTEFVREERLKRARRMLLSPRLDHLLIREIAYGVGFNDLT